MEVPVSIKVTKSSKLAPSLAIAAAVATLLFLVSLHVLSPEFDPSWRMVSEYALGHYGWVLSLMFFSWAVSSFALAFALRLHLQTRLGRIGLWMLIISGVGEAMASVFDITQDIPHSVAGYLGIVGLPIAAMLISISLGRTGNWSSSAKKWTLLISNLTWISTVLYAASLIIMTIQALQAYGGQLPSQAPAVLPPGVFHLAGWADRLLIAVYCGWNMIAAWYAIKYFVK
jgi:hypothetical protein